MTSASRGTGGEGTPRAGCTEVRRWGGSGEGEGEFDAPAGLAIAPDGRVVVADAFNNCVQLFTSDGRLADRWGGIGWGLGGGWRGWFRVAKEVALDSTGHLWVADSFNGRVQVLDGRGAVGSGVRRVECP